MAAPINLINVQLLNNHCHAFDPFIFRITIQCIPPGIEKDLDWKIVYVGSAESESYDQELDSISIGPVQYGLNEFEFETIKGPDPNKIPENDLLEVTVVLLSCWYRQHEFIRVGYYVINEYIDPEYIENPPNSIKLDKIYRNVEEEARVTKYNIPWDNQNEIFYPSINPLTKEGEMLDDQNMPDDIVFDDINSNEEDEEDMDDEDFDENAEYDIEND